MTTQEAAEPFKTGLSVEVNHAQSNKYFLLLYCVGTLEPSSGGEGVSKEIGREKGRQSIWGKNVLSCW